MKTFKLFAFYLLLSSFSAFSQYGYNNINRYSGVDRSIGRNYSTPRKDSPEDIEKSREENVTKFMARLKQELNLDELQVIAIRNEVISNGKNVDIVMKKEGSEEEKTKEVKALTEATDANITSYLNKEQKEKYLLFKSNIKDKKKDKKGKKEEDSKPEE